MSDFDSMKIPQCINGFGSPQAPSDFRNYYRIDNDDTHIWVWWVHDDTKLIKAQIEAIKANKARSGTARTDGWAFPTDRGGCTG